MILEKNLSKTKAAILSKTFNHFTRTLCSVINSIHNSSPSCVQKVNYLLLNQKPINLLFSTDQFLFEFSKKKPLRRKISEYSKQLKERRKILLFYGKMSKKSLIQYAKQAKMSKGDFSRNFFSLLEKRLDVVLFRSNFVETLLEARQLILHGHILVNNILIINPKYMVEPADIISVRENIKENLERKSKEKLVWNKVKKKISFKKNHEKRGLLNQDLLSLNTEKRTFQKKNEKDSHSFFQSIHRKSNPNAKKWIYQFLSLLGVLTLKRISYKKKLIDTKNQDFLMIKTFLTGKALDSSLFLKQLKKEKKYLVFMKIKNFVGESRKNSRFLKNRRDSHCFKIENFKTKQLSPEKKTMHQFFKNLPNPFIWPWWYQEQGILFQKTSLASTKSNSNCFKIENFKTNSFIPLNKQSIKNKPSLFLRMNKIMEKNTFFFLAKLLKNSKTITTNCFKIENFKTKQDFEKKDILVKKIKELFYKNQHRPDFMQFNQERKQKNSFKKTNMNDEFDGRLKKSRPLHLEISYKNKFFIFLYSPQRISFPFFINMDLFERWLH